MKTRSSTKKNNPLILGLTFLIISNSVFAANKKPADLIVSPGARSALENAFGPDWENLVNSDPDRFYNGQNRGFLPANWKEMIAIPVPQKAEKPSDFIVDPYSQAELQSIYGADWRKTVDSNPDKFLHALPSNWKGIIGENDCTYIYNGKCLVPDKVEKPSDLIKNKTDIETLTKLHGENWKDEVNNNPDYWAQKGFIPKDWNSRVGADGASSSNPSNSSDSRMAALASAEETSKFWSNPDNWTFSGSVYNSEKNCYESQIVATKPLPSGSGDTTRGTACFKTANPTPAEIEEAKRNFTFLNVAAQGTLKIMQDQGASSGTSTEQRPSDTVASFDRAFMEEKYGANWEELVNANPNDYTFSKGGKVPPDWLGRSLRPYGSVRPSDLITDSASIEALKEKYGDDWKKHVDLVPEGYLNYLPDDWADQIRKGKQTSSNVADNSSSPGASENSNELPGATENPSSTGKGMSKNDGGGSVANQLLALGTGIIGSNILLSCKLGSVTPSIIAFGAGSMTYIGSEIFGAKAQQAFIKVKKDEIAQLKATMTQGGDLQRGIIEAKIKETEEKLAFVKKRKTWTTAVTAMYGAATGLAAMEFACTKNIITLPSCTQWTAAICDGASSLPSSLVLQGAVVGAYGLAVGNAGGSAVSTFGTALASLGLLVKGVSSTVAVAYQTPETRIATFGVGTALAAKVMADLGKVEGDLKNNINDLKALLADYDKKTQDAGGIDEGAGAVDLAKDNVNLMQGSGNVNRMAIGDDMNKHCWGKDSQGLQTYSEEACNNSLTLAKPKYSSKFSLPTLQSVANTGVDMAQAVARGDMGAADIAAANLASNAMRVQEVTDKLLNDIAEQQKKAGKKPVDYQKAIQDGVAKMHKDLNQSLGKQGIDLAKLPAGSSLLDAKDYANPSNEINTAKASLGAGSNESAGMNLNLDEGSSDELLFNRSANVAAVSHTLEDFETQESDILARPEESIFKQLSNRYFLNYNKIFETKSAPPAQSK